MTDAELPELTDAELAFLETVFDLAREGKTAEVKSLVEQGIPVDLTNSKGDTLLILAAYYKHEELVEALIALDADTSRVNDNGQTALVAGVFRNNVRIVTALLAAGADPALGAHPALAIAQQFGLSDMEALLS
jgi:ankyrin repeat protein